MNAKFENLVNSKGDKFKKTNGFENQMNCCESKRKMKWMDWMTDNLIMNIEVMRIACTKKHGLYTGFMIKL